MNTSRSMNCLEQNTMNMNGTQQYLPTAANSANMIQSNGSQTSNGFKGYGSQPVTNDSNQTSLDYYQFGVSDLQKNHNDRVSFF